MDIRQQLTHVLPPCLCRVDINAKNAKGNIACHYALAYGFEDVGDYLIAHGSDEYLQNEEGLTCWEGLTKKDLVDKWG